MSIQSHFGYHYGIKWARNGVASLRRNFGDAVKTAGLTAPEDMEKLSRALQSASRVLQQWTDEGVGEIILESWESDPNKRLLIMARELAAVEAGWKNSEKDPQGLSVHIRPAEAQP